MTPSKTKPPKLYIDMTSLMHDDINTGIQRVETNIANVCFERAIRFQLEPHTVILGMRDYRVFDWPRSRRGFYAYSIRIYTRFLRLRKLKKLIRAVIPLRSFRDFIVKYGEGYRGVVLKATVFLCVLPVILLSLAYLLTTRPPRRWRPSPGDVLLIPGISWLELDIWTAVRRCKGGGAMVAIVLYDTIPITHSDRFPRSFAERFKQFLPVVCSNADLIVTISNTAKQSLEHYLRQAEVKTDARLASFKLGADFHKGGADPIRPQVVSIFNQNMPVLLCVGTIEPRKNYGYVLDAFERLWRDNVEIGVCIVGRRGWMQDELLRRIFNHAEYKKRLFWFGDLNDSELAVCYERAAALVFASVVEGFGLPLVEALGRGCPVLASDIPVFREIGDKFCRFFSLDSPDCLASAVRDALESGRPNQAPTIRRFQWPGWRESVEELLSIIDRTAKR